MNSAETSCHIEASGLHYSYPGGTKMSFPDLCFGRGEHWLITGSSGSGKTTLLHLLAGLRQPDGGKVSVNGNNLADMRRAELDRFRGREIGIVFQTSHFVQSLNVLENLELAAFLAGKKTDKARNKNLLDRLGLEHKGRKKPHQLSVGEQQRAGIARAMVNRPSVVLADEPTASLDDENCRKMIELLRQECSESNATLITVTHDQRVKELIQKVVAL